ncbi:hypothetical protein PFUGPA_02540 [Plasmodium falciparum Palo Alto/Uganda]|uniref:Uncharacterized protein n=3 Tax=Plasmodium falciparum TaxID=5833 RepID=W4IZH8_PLAFP|nr:hypothetical protein PFMALIP_05727 [Plasmodium falciparum MaliPS096_E11]ETW55380.1 hypothetical protein PFUGPA_02540 [Plasmodium falciparum Palo Alto/Uganda]
MEILIYELTCDIFKNVEKQKRHFNKLLKKNNKILLLLFCTTLFNFVLYCSIFFFFFYKNYEPAIDYFIKFKWTTKKL